ncbi:MAG: CPBP family intramembrane metalloprotease [Phycisphaerae bacterium]|nr:CPBP family intramembrane metalloprotease [Phycisphaerae bacterium]
MPFASLKNHLKGLPLGLITGISIAGLMLILYFLTPFGNIINNGSANVIARAEAMGVKQHFLLYAIVISIFHSLLEEYYWRWFVFGRLSKAISLKWATIISALAFGGYHYILLSRFYSPLWVIILGTGVSAGGLIWAWQYHKHKSIASVWLSHCLVDAAIFIVAYQLIFKVN